MTSWIDVKHKSVNFVFIIITMTLCIAFCFVFIPLEKLITTDCLLVINNLMITLRLILCEAITL